MALYEQGKLDEARLRAEALAREFPDAPFIANLLGIVNAALGRLEQAVTAFENALRVDPRFAEAHFNLGGVLDSLGMTREAVASYTRAIRIKPDFAKAYNNLGADLQDLGMPEAAAASYAKAIHFRPDFAEAHNNLGAVLDLLKRPEDAVASCRNALRLVPAYAEAHNNLGNALLHLGKPEDALASYTEALRMAPDYAEAHRNLSTLKTYRPGDPQIRRMLTLIERRDLADDDRTRLGFALGKAHDDLGEHDLAFRFFAAANRLRKQALGYQPSSTREKLEGVMAAFANETPALRAAGDSGPEPEIIFILGMPRSGTSLVEQILASHSAVHGAGELDLLDRAVNAADWRSGPLSVETLLAVRRAYLSGIGKLGVGAAHVTDKMPLNFWWIGFIVAALPRAKIVHVRRDARATCWSSFRHYFPSRGLGFTNDLRDLAEYFKACADLMAFWHERFPGRIHDLSYEALTENQQDETRKLLEHVGLSWEDGCLEFHRTDRAVHTLSAAQVRKRLYRGSSGEWQKYRRHLEPMIELLEDY